MLPLSDSERAELAAMKNSKTVDYVRFNELMDRDAASRWRGPFREALGMYFGHTEYTAHVPSAWSPTGWRVSLLALLAVACAAHWAFGVGPVGSALAGVLLGALPVAAWGFSASWRDAKMFDAYFAT